MKLANEFYTLLRHTETEFEVKLNAEHSIYRAHFPNNPITPGVCIVQMVKELLEGEHHKKYFLARVALLKFLAPVNPQAFENVFFRFLKLEKTENSCCFSVVVANGETLFVKFSGELRENNQN